MTYTHKITILAVVSAILLLAALLPFINVQKAEVVGSAEIGTISRLDFATTTTVGPEARPAVRIFSNDSDCDARVVTTRGDSAIMISFGEPINVGDISSTTVLGATGHLQLASTTVVYDSGLYGCGQWHAYGFASTTITVSEF